jgi:hypothetical protein
MPSLDPILNLFIGLALTFGSFSLLTGAIVEALASARAWRSKTLVTGIGQMLNDTTLQGVAAKVLEHPAVNPLLAVAPDGKLNAKRPAYIEPAQFAAALVDVLKIPEQIEDGAGRLEAALMHVEDPQLKRFLTGLLERAKGDMAQFRSGIAAWFDSAMDRVSGGYKRNVQLWNFLVALALAAGMNVNALAVAQQLWVQPGLSASLAASIRATSPPPPALPVPVAQPPADAGEPPPPTQGPQQVDPQQQSYEQLYSLWSRSLPFGWANVAVPQGSWDWAKTVALLLAGWMISASSTLFGAPFWFDTLQKLARIRSSGPSPREAAAARGEGQAVVRAGLQVGAATAPPG